LIFYFLSAENRLERQDKNTSAGIWDAAKLYLSFLYFYEQIRGRFPAAFYLYLVFFQNIKIKKPGITFPFSGKKRQVVYSCLHFR